ncbi:MAG: ABC transporter ATP-binding protein [Oscillochloris sp.]|nr:ABC transporter ATP-binding protein [Oscillochloris sp.]
MSRVELRGLSKSFGPVQAVRDVSLDISDHAFVTLLGPSGCGKTTTLNMTAGLEAVSSGDVLLDGVPITGWAPHERGMAMVFQNYALYPHMNVFDNIGFALKLQRRPRAEIERRVRATAEALELGALLERRISQLSGGQQQRVALARAMVKEPQVFLFDEPLSNLDAALRTRMRIEIKRLHQQLRTTSIFVTHDQEEAMILSDFIAVMRDGVVVQYGPADEVYRRPAHHYVATFIGKPRMGIVTGRLRTSGEVAEFTAAGLQMRWRDPAILVLGPGDREVLLGVRAEDARIVARVDQDEAGFDGAVELLEPLGSDTFVEVGRGEHRLTARVEPDKAPRLAEPVRLRLPWNRLHLFDAATEQRINA